MKSSLIKTLELVADDLDCKGPLFTAAVQALALASIAESLQQIAWLAEEANRGDE
jgi:hypothetical protein